MRVRPPKRPWHDKVERLERRLALYQAAVRDYRKLCEIASPICQRAGLATLGPMLAKAARGERPYAAGRRSEWTVVP